MAPVKERKQNVLFDTLASLFNNKEYINGLTQESIKQNYFMLNRRLAIMYPLQAQVFNRSKVNPVDVLHFWSDYLYNGKFPPRWIYTAGAAKSQAKKDDKKEVTSPRDVADYRSAVLIAGYIAVDAEKVKNIASEFDQKMSKFQEDSRRLQKEKDLFKAAYNKVVKNKPEFNLTNR